MRKQIQKSTRPAIEKMEQRIHDHRLDIAATLDLDPNEVLREGDLDPALIIETASHALRLIEHKSADRTEQSFHQIDELIAETEEIITVSQNVLEHADTVREDISTRLSELPADHTFEIESLLRKADQAYAEGKLLTAGRLLEQSTNLLSQLEHQLEQNRQILSRIGKTKQSRARRLALASPVLDHQNQRPPHPQANSDPPRTTGGSHQQSRKRSRSGYL